MFEHFNEQEQQYYSQVIRERVLEIKSNIEDLERVKESFINIFNNNKDNSNSLKSILGEKNLGLIISDDIKFMHQFSLELLTCLVREISDNQYDEIIKTLKDQQVDQEIISHIEISRDKQSKNEFILYFSLNIIAILGAFLFYYTNYHRMVFIPIYTQILVIVASLRFKKAYAIKSGLILSLLNFTLVLPLKEVIFTFDYQLTIFLIIGFLLLGLIVAILPNYLNQLLKPKIKTEYRLYLATFISSLLFTVILILGNIHYTSSIHSLYQFNPLYQLVQVIFISIICVQVIDIMNRK